MHMHFNYKAAGKISHILSTTALNYPLLLQQTTLHGRLMKHTHLGMSSCRAELMSGPGALPRAPSAQALLPEILTEAPTAAGGTAWLCSGAASEAVLNASSEGLGMLKRGEMPASISSRESALHSLIK